MEENKVPAPGQESAPQAPSTPPSAPAPAGAEGGNGDPLDQISDPELLRHEAKKYRGIATRHVDAPPAAPAAPAPAAQSAGDFVTKRDLQLINERKAFTIVKADPEIEQNFEAIKGLYVNRRGSDTPEDIAEDMKDAFTVWKSRQTPKPGDAAAGLATITVPNPSGIAPAPQASATETDPRFKTGATPSEWYQKKS